MGQDNFVTEGVKGADFDAVGCRADYRNQPLAHIDGSRIGEGEAQDGRGRCLGLLKNVGNPQGNSLGLAGTGTGNNHYRPFDSIDGLFLFGV